MDLSKRKKKFYLDLRTRKEKEIHTSFWSLIYDHSSQTTKNNYFAKGLIVLFVK